MRISDWSSDVCSSDLIEASGMTTLMVPEAAGGFGGGWSDGAVLFRLVGYHAVALPIVEATIVAGYVAGIDGLSGFGTIAGPVAGERQGDRFSGTLRAVPWGREAGHVVVQDAGGCFALHVADAIIEQAVSPAGEPRDTLDRKSTRLNPSNYC